MTGFTQSPRLLKGGLVLIDPDSAQVLRIISLQYNPETLTRSLQVQARGGEGGNRSRRRCASRGRRWRRSSSRPRSTPPISSSFPTRTATTVENGIQPQLAVLETLAQSDQRAVAREVNRQASAGTLEIAPMEAPLTLFVWSKSRIVPVRLTEFSHHRGGLRPGAQSDPRQGQPRPARAVGGRPRLRAQGRQPVHELSAGARSSSPPRRQAGTLRRPLGIGGIAHDRPAYKAFLQANALDRAGCSRRPAATTALPTAQLDAAGRHGRCPTCKRRFVPPPEHFALLRRAPGRAGRPARQPGRALPRRPAAVLAHLRRQRRDAARRADRDRRAARCASRCPKAFPERAMLAKGIQLTLMIGPVVPIPAPRVVIDALDSVEVTTAAGSASGFQLTLPVLGEVGAEHDLPDRRRQQHLARHAAAAGDADRHAQRHAAAAVRRRDDQRRGAGRAATARRAPSPSPART